MGGCTSCAESDEVYNKAAHSDKFRQPNIRQTNKGKDRHINPSEQSDPINIPPTNSKSIGVCQAGQ